MDCSGMVCTFSAKVWYSEWYFVSLPKEIAADIRMIFKGFEEGWGRLKVVAKIGGSEWKTAIWFDTKKQTYLLPIKADIRKRETIDIDQVVGVTLWVS